MRIPPSRLASLLAFLVLSLPAGAQTVLLSSTSYNGGGPDQALGAARASNGDLYVAGSSSNGASGIDIWLGRYDSSLNLLNSVTVNGSGNGDDIAYNVVVAADGTVYAVGATSVATRGPQPWMGRFSSSLVLLSSAVFATPSNATANQTRAVAFSSAGELFTAGNMATSTFTMRNLFAKHDPTTLAIISSATYYGGYGYISSASDIESLTADVPGFLYMTGSIPPASGASNDLWLVKYDTSLNFISSATKAGAGGNTDAGLSVLAHPNGSIYVTGILNNSGATVDLWVGRYSSSLALLSSFSLNGSANANDQGHGLALGNGGNILVAGQLGQTGQGDDIYVAEYTAGLALVSSRTLTSAGAVVDAGYAVVSDTAAGQAWVAGSYGSPTDAWLGQFSITPATPTAPSGFSGVAFSSRSILWSWTDSSSNESGFRVIYGGGNISGDLAANTTTWLQTGLGVNTTSGMLLARAFNAGGTADSGQSAFFYTLTDPPNSISVTVFGSSASFTWPAMANPAGTRWSVERSTDQAIYAQLYFSSAAAAYQDPGPLSVSSTYYYRIGSANGDGTLSYHANASAIVWTGAGSVPPAPSAFAGTAQSTSSILWTWNDNASNETGYRVMSGASNLSGDLAAGTSLWLQTGLGVGASTGPLSAQAFNSTGTANSGTASRYTLANAPGTPSASGVFTTSATISWAANGNPGSVVYQLERSTGGAYAIIMSSAAVSFLDTTLTPSVTHYYRALALNGDSVATVYTATGSAVALPGLSLPAAPGAFAGAAQSASSILWSWTDIASNETGYRVMSGASNLSGDLAAGTTLWLQTGLGVDMSTGPLFAQAFNSSGTANSGTASRYTLANAPGAPSASSVFQTSATLSWAANGNPGAVLYQLERSTGGAYSILITTFAASYLDTTLTAGATHYYRALALNGDSVATVYSATGSAVALPPTSAPLAPGGFAGAAQTTGSILWTWTDNAPNEDGYRVMSGASDLSGDLAAGTTLWLQTGLGIGASTGPLLAQAFNSSGTANSGTASRFTLAAAPGTPSASGV
jgi:hypothetical protein